MPFAPMNPHRCSIEVEGKWVKKWWAEGQPWHKGAGECGSGGGGTHGGNDEGSNRESECGGDGDSTRRF
jgi:hypothetical protein